MWLAEYRIEPWGEERQDVRSAALLLSNTSGLTMEQAMDFVNPWPKAAAPLPNKAQLAEKIKLFNAGIAKIRQGK